MFDMENLKNTFALFGIIMFSRMVVLTISDMYYRIKLWGFKEGLKRWINGK